MCVCVRVCVMCVACVEISIYIFICDDMLLFSLSLFLPSDLSVLILLTRLHSQSERIFPVDGTALRRIVRVLHSRRRKPMPRETAKRWPQRGTHPKTLKSSRGPRRGSRLGSGWLWWGGWRCGQWLRGWWGWKLRGGGCSSRSRRPLRGISLPLTHRGGGVNNSPVPWCASVAFRLCPALRQLTRLLPRSFSYFRPRSPSGMPLLTRRGNDTRRRTSEERSGELFSRISRGFRAA